MNQKAIWPPAYKCQISTSNLEYGRFLNRLFTLVIWKNLNSFYTLVIGIWKVLNSFFTLVQGWEFAPLFFERITGFW